MAKKNLVKNRADEYIAKIEGHGSLAIDWKKGKVELNVHEGERLFEGILVGRTADEMHWITPRICGVCPIAHNLASLAATEDALGIYTTDNIKALRRLMQVGQNVQSHILHAVFLALPDYIGIDRITELDFKDPAKFELALFLKELGDEIAYVVAGRNVHPTRTTIGGFHKIPTREEFKSLLEKIKTAIPKAKALAEFFATLSYPELQVDLEFLAQKDGKVISNKREAFNIKDYKKNIEEEVKKYSTAKFGSYNGNVYMVGSLARLYHKSFYDKDISSFNLDFKNPYHNNLAQTIEAFFELEEAASIIERLLEENIDNIATAIPVDKRCLFGDGQGIGAVEAPRGGLYNEVHFDKNGIIKYANIITPTVQNLTSMENTAEALLAQHREKSHKEIERLMEMLIRAYDPCITCSVH